MEGDKSEGEEEEALSMEVVLYSFAFNQLDRFMETVNYVHNHKVDVANGSFGLGFPDGLKIVNEVYKYLHDNEEPSRDDLIKYTAFFMFTLVEEGKKVAESAPNTLFVFAAGNDGLDNDFFPASPTNIAADNVISVAATFGRTELAQFSNYGATKVHVAAPGVNIESASPGDRYMAISGTSQAAPYVTNVVSMIKDANEELTPAQIKKIVMETVDKKDFLTGKVASGGIVNPMRALKAAEYSTTNLSIDESVALAKVDVEDVPAEKSNFVLRHLPFEEFIMPLPTGFEF